MRKVGIVGHFGDGKNLLNGQTIKTKIITDELIKQYGDNEVKHVDTHGIKKAPIKKYNEIRKLFIQCDNIIMLPAHNGVKVLTPLFLKLNKKYKRKLHYVVIGGWLPELLVNKPSLSKQLKQFDYIYVETNIMKSKLDKLGFDNIVVLPNCKELPILDFDELVFQQGNTYEFCTFSRVMKEKGIEDAVNVIREINEEVGYVKVKLDIYGQIDSNQIEWFNTLQESFPDYIQYKGLVPFDKSTDVVKQYYALLFPTYYSGEGFAGTLLDAYAAGVPVIASDWRYNQEIVKHEETGLIYATRDNQQFKDSVLWLIKNRDEWSLMKSKCLKEALLYSPGIVINEVMRNFD